jgi:hypothetical protein
MYSQVFRQIRNLVGHELPKRKESDNDKSMKIMNMPTRPSSCGSLWPKTVVNRWNRLSNRYICPPTTPFISQQNTAKGLTMYKQLNTRNRSAFADSENHIWELLSALEECWVKFLCSINAKRLSSNSYKHAVLVDCSRIQPLHFLWGLVH